MSVYDLTVTTITFKYFQNTILIQVVVMAELFTVYRKLTKVGTGVAVFLPPEFLKKLGVSDDKDDNFVEVILTDDNKIIIKKMR